MPDSARVDHLDILVVPQTAPESLARGLAVTDLPSPSLVALVVNVPEAQSTAVRFLDPSGRPAEVDPGRFARVLSVGGHTVGVARIDPGANTRRFELYRNGAVLHVFTPEDELYVPHDEDGFPDMEVPPVRQADGVPEGWRRLRSALDLGMQRLVSCRFTPVAHAFERLARGEDLDVRAFALSVAGRALHPPQEIPWAELFRR